MKIDRNQELRDLRERISTMDLDETSEEKAIRIIEKINERVGEASDISDTTLKMFMEDEELDNEFGRDYLDNHYHSSNYDDDDGFGSYGGGSGVLDAVWVS